MGLSYDDDGNTDSVTPPGQPEHAFNYTPVDQESRYSPPDIGLPEHDTTRLYNLDRQQTDVTRPDGLSISSEYGATTGRLDSITSPLGTTSYTYDSAGRVDTATSPDGEMLGYEYDGPLLTRQAWTGTVNGSVEYVYNNNLRIERETVNGADPIDYVYDDDGLMTQAGDMAIARDAASGRITGTTLDQVTTSTTYNEFGELETYTARFDTTVLFATVYERDQLGRIIQITETVEGSTLVKGYEYDDAGRLWRVYEDTVLMREYTYDDNGNRLAVLDGRGVVIESGTHDAQDRLLSYGDSTYEYTANGELLSKTTGGLDQTDYDYDVHGNLRSVMLPDGILVEYQIDPGGRRVGRVVDGVAENHWLWSSQLGMAAELDEGGAVTSRYVRATGINVPDYIDESGSILRIITDHLGSPRLVVDTTTGAVVQRLDYDEWGKVTRDDNPGLVPFGFAGGIYDAETGLVRFGFRDYDPEIGRWTAKDPIGFRGGDTNLYVYVGNRPTNLTDPTGEVAWVVVACLVALSGGTLVATELLDALGDLELVRAEKAAVLIAIRELRANQDDCEYERYQMRMAPLLARLAELTRAEADAIWRTGGSGSVSTGVIVALLKACGF